MNPRELSRRVDAMQRKLAKLGQLEVSGERARLDFEVAKRTGVYKPRHVQYLIDADPEGCRRKAKYLGVYRLRYGQPPFTFGRPKCMKDYVEEILITPPEEELPDWMLEGLKKEISLPLRTFRPAKKRYEFEWAEEAFDAKICGLVMAKDYGLSLRKEIHAHPEQWNAFIAAYDGVPDFFAEDFDHDAWLEAFIRKCNPNMMY